MITLNVRWCTSYETTRRMVVWVKSKCQKSWLVSSLMETRKFDITNRRNKKNISSWRNSDLLTKKSKQLIFHRNWNALINCFHQARHIGDYVTWRLNFDFFASHWVMKTIYLVAPLRLAVFATSTCNRQVKQHARMKDIVISVSLLQSHLTLVWLLAPLIARPLSFASERKRWCK